MVSSSIIVNRKIYFSIFKKDFHEVYSTKWNAQGTDLKNEMENALQ